MAESHAIGGRVHSSSMRSPILFAVLSFLLLSMQHEGKVHALSHLGSQLTRSHDTELKAPHADGACVECALLAAGSSTVNGDLPALQSPALVTERAWLVFRSRTADVPAYYSSRAPPVLL